MPLSFWRQNKGLSWAASVPSASLLVVGTQLTAGFVPAARVKWRLEKEPYFSQKKESACRVRSEQKLVTLGVGKACGEQANE